MYSFQDNHLKSLWRQCRCMLNTNPHLNHKQHTTSTAKSIARNEAAVYCKSNVTPGGSHVSLRRTTIWPCRSNVNSFHFPPKRRPRPLCPVMSIVIALLIAFAQKPRQMGVRPSNGRWHEVTDHDNHEQPWENTFQPRRQTTCLLLQDWMDRAQERKASVMWWRSPSESSPNDNVYITHHSALIR